MENIHYDAMMNHTVHAIIPVLKYSTGDIKKPDDVFTYQFQNRVIILMQIMEEKNKTYNQALNKIDLVTKLIDKERKANNVHIDHNSKIQLRSMYSR